MRTGVAALSVVIVAATSCAGSSDSRPAGPPSSDARASEVAATAAVMDGIGARAANGSGRSSWTTLADLLPNALVGDPISGDRAPSMDAAFVGRIVVVAPGRGFVVPGDDAPDGVSVEFDDPGSRWKTVYLDVEVDEPLGRAGALSEGSTVTVGLVVGADLELGVVRRALLDGADRVFFVYEGSPVFADREDVFAIAGDGSLLVEVDADGTLRLPAFDSDVEGRNRAAALLSGVETLDLLRTAAEAAPREVVPPAPMGS